MTIGRKALHVTIRFGSPRGLRVILAHARDRAGRKGPADRQMTFPYEAKFRKRVGRLKREGRYRVFTDIVRQRGIYPQRRFLRRGRQRPITVWCSNDYLGMGQHPKVLAAMHGAIDPRARGSGGTRNISGTTHYHVELEARAGRSARQGSGA